jgi:tetratricopeptide (TPR) repeat protein
MDFGSMTDPHSPDSRFNPGELAHLKGLLNAGLADPDSLAVQAARLSKEGRLDDAKELYLAILAGHPDHLTTLEGFGSLLHQTQYRSAAITVFRRLLQLQPERASSHASLGHVLWDHGDPGGARSHFEEALRLDASSAVAHQGMAAVLMKLRQEEEAWEHARLGFGAHPFLHLPYRGQGSGATVLILCSARGGNIPLRQAIDDHVFRAVYGATEFLDPAVALPQHQVLWNSIGEADGSQAALKQAEIWAQQSRVPVINPPDRVALTGRADNVRRLAGIPGLRLPRTLACRRADLGSASCGAFLAAGGFAFPLLLRAQGFHAGQHFLKIETLDQLSGALAALPGQDFLAIEFIDARGADGKCRKYRVMMIDGRLYPLHAAISENWKIHFFSADMTNSAQHRREDEAFLSDMAGVLGSRALKVLQQVQAVLGLDYAGMDFGLDAAGDVLFFEANATMSIVPPGLDPLWDYRRAPVARALEAVTKMLQSRLTTSA